MTHVYEKIRAVDYSNLPESIRQAMLSRPEIATPVHFTEKGFELARPVDLQMPASVDFMPKLGIKSWQTSGSLGLIYQGVNIHTVVDTLLSKPTHAQKIAAKAWAATELASQNSPVLNLYLYPYIDFSQVTEVRFQINHQQCRKISACLRSQPQQQFEQLLPKWYKLARDIAAHLPNYSHLLDMAHLPTGKIGIVEINPALTLSDLKVLDI